ncbi:MAG: DUF1043 family protein [Gammaproteobacteria bacterium]|nr:DUF1043 family protein [Gammaproteobacteria bacterium]
MEYLFELTIVAGTFVAGIFIGKFIAPDARRIKELKKDLEESNQQHLAYKEGVAKHFSESANLFGDITEKYRSMYKHMSSGAYELCDRRSIPRELAASHVNILAVETPEVSPKLTDTGVPSEGESETATVSTTDTMTHNPKSSDELIVDVTKSGLSPLGMDNHSIAMKNKKLDENNTAEVIDLDSQRTEEDSNSEPVQQLDTKQAKDYAIKAKGVINHNSLNRDDVKT